MICARPRAGNLGGFSTADRQARRLGMPQTKVLPSSVICFQVPSTKLFRPPCVQFSPVLLISVLLIQTTSPNGTRNAEIEPPQNYHHDDRAPPAGGGGGRKATDTQDREQHRPPRFKNSFNCKLRSCKCPLSNKDRRLFLSGREGVSSEPPLFLLPLPTRSEARGSWQKAAKASRSAVAYGFPTREVGEQDEEAAGRQNLEKTGEGVGGREEVEAHTPPLLHPSGHATSSGTQGGKSCSEPDACTLVGKLSRLCSLYKFFFFYEF